MIVLYVLAYVYGFYGLFLIYCTVMHAKKTGKLATMPIIVRWVPLTYVLLGGIVDFLFNVTLGELIFWEAPWGHGLLFTDRCRSHRHDGDWRQKIADWVCDGWLNPMEAGHC